MLLLKSGPAPFALLDEPYTPRIRCAGHLDMGLHAERLETQLPRVLAVLRGHHFDAIACQGLSGLLVAPIIARELGKSLLIVRKETEGCHSIRMVEGDYAARRYVILDDFISSGATCQRIVDEIGDAMPEAQCIGVLEYLYPNKNGVLMDAPFKTPARFRAQRKVVGCV